MAKKPAKKAPAVNKTGGNSKSRISLDDIALRAYFIAEKRQQEGRHGDSHQDWIEAERQIRAESSSGKSKAKKAATA